MHITKDNIVVGDSIEFSIDVGLGDLQLAVLRAHGDKIIQVDAVTGESQSASIILNKSICLAKWMLKMGVKPGDSITINSENRLEFCLVPLAAFFVGAIFAPLNPEYTPNELSHVLSLSRPKLAFCSEKSYNIMKDSMKNHKFIQKLIVFGKSGKTGDVRFEEIVKGITEHTDYEDFKSVQIDPKETVATVFCSSGTTGLPKGVMCTHSNMTSFIEIARARIQELLNDDPDFLIDIRIMGTAPFFHSMGFMTMYLNLIPGNLMVILRRFSPKIFFNAIEKYKVTTMSMAPPVALVLLHHPLAGKYDLSSLKDVRTGAAPMGIATEQELQSRFMLEHVSQSYGMTESTLAITMSTKNVSKPGSVGIIVPGMMCKVIDENGNALGPNQEGEVCAKGPIIMKGYIGDPVATKNTIDKDGWLHTGDVGYYDTNGYFYIVDRLKELIKYKGFQVAPAELEALLLTHPAVADSAVIGKTDELAGELPTAFVVKKPGRSVTEKELQDFVADSYSIVKYFIYNKWHTQYMEGPKGAGYKSFVEIPLKKPWWGLKVIGKKSVSTLSRVRSGHGLCKEYLWRINQAENPYCVCGEVEDLNHIIFKCNRYNIKRAPLIKALNKLTSGPYNLGILCSLNDWDIYNAVIVFLKCIDCAI